MTGWLVVPFPEGDPDSVHVVPAKGEEPDPIHVPSTDCPCRPRVLLETDLSFRDRKIVSHAGPQ